MNDCHETPARKPSKPKKNQVEFQVANPDARLSPRAIEALARLLLSVPENGWTENSTPIAA